jgi:hypothetical protein
LAGEALFAAAVHPPPLPLSPPPRSPSRYCRTEASFSPRAREREPRVDGDVGVGCDGPDNAREEYITKKTKKENMRTVCGLSPFTRYSLSSPIQSIHHTLFVSKDRPKDSRERERRIRGW